MAHCLGHLEVGDRGAGWTAGIICGETWRLGDKGCFPGSQGWELVNLTTQTKISRISICLCVQETSLLSRLINYSMGGASWHIVAGTGWTSQLCMTSPVCTFGHAKSITVIGKTSANCRLNSRQQLRRFLFHLSYKRRSRSLSCYQSVNTYGLASPFPKVIEHPYGSFQENQR